MDTLRIKNTNKATKELHNDDYMEHGYSVVFNEEHEEFNVANVKREVGKALVETDEYPTIDRYSEPDSYSGESDNGDNE